MTCERVTSQEENIGKAIVETAHRSILYSALACLEKIYETFLVHKLRKERYEIERQVSLPIEYEGIIFEERLRIDILVEIQVIAEIKGSERSKSGLESAGTKSSQTR